MKLLILTDKARLDGYKKDILRFRDGRVVKLRDYTSVITFGEPGLRLPCPPVHINVGEEDLVIKDLSSPDIFGSATLEPFLKMVDLTERVLGKLMHRNGIYSLGMLLNWLEGYRPFYLTLCALLLAITFPKYRFIFNPEDKATLEGRSVKLRDIFFLPCTAYAVLKELEKILYFGCDKLSAPKECVNASLSYIVGNPFFEILYLRSIRLISEFRLLEPHHAKTHRGFPSRPRKLRKPRKRVQPSDGLFVL